MLQGFLSSSSPVYTRVATPHKRKFGLPAGRQGKEIRTERAYRHTINFLMRVKLIITGTSRVRKGFSTSPLDRWSVAPITRPIFIRLCVGDGTEAEYSSTVLSGVNANSFYSALGTAHATASSLQSLSFRAKRSEVEEPRGNTLRFRNGMSRLRST